MVDEVIKSVQQGIKDRIRNPLIGAFIISWCFRNWKIIVILIYGDSIDDRFTMISELDIGWRSLFVTPLAYAATYVLIMPWITFWIHRYQFGVYAKGETDRIITQGRLDSEFDKTQLNRFNSTRESHEIKNRHHNELEKIESLNIAKITHVNLQTNALGNENKDLQNTVKTLKIEKARLNNQTNNQGMAIHKLNNTVKDLEKEIKGLKSGDQ